jgi:hypothetical protein
MSTFTLSIGRSIGAPESAAAEVLANADPADGAEFLQIGADDFFALRDGVDALLSELGQTVYARGVADGIDENGAAEECAIWVFADYRRNANMRRILEDGIAGICAFYGQRCAALVVGETSFIGAAR